MNDKKIYFLINSLEAGGAENVITKIANHLAENKTSVKILSLKKGKFYSLSNKVIFEPLVCISNNLLMMLLLPVYFLKIKRIIKIEKPNIFISFLEISNFINILINGNKAIISMRTSMDFFNLKKDLKSRLYLFLINWLYPKAGKIIFNSNENLLLVKKKLCISDNKTLLIYNPIGDNSLTITDDILLKKLANELNGKRIFITVSRITEEKNHELLIKSFKSLIEIDDSNILLIVGDGPLRKKMEYLTLILDLKDNVRFLGTKDNVSDYLKIANYFIYASKCEGFPNVLIEAMQSDLPIITTDFKTGAREIIAPDLNYTIKINYPYFGPNGVILSSENYAEELISVYKDIAKLKQLKIGIERFNIYQICEVLKNIRIEEV